MGIFDGGTCLMPTRCLFLPLREQARLHTVGDHVAAADLAAALLYEFIASNSFSAAASSSGGALGLIHINGVDGAVPLDGGGS